MGWNKDKVVDLNLPKHIPGEEVSEERRQANAEAAVKRQASFNPHEALEKAQERMDERFYSIQHQYPEYIGLLLTCYEHYYGYFIGKDDFQDFNFLVSLHLTLLSQKSSSNFIQELIDAQDNKEHLDFDKARELIYYIFNFEPLFYFAVLPNDNYKVIISSKILWDHKRELCDDELINSVILPEFLKYESKNLFKVKKEFENINELRLELMKFGFSECVDMINVI